TELLMPQQQARPKPQAPEPPMVQPPQPEPQAQTPPPPQPQPTPPPKEMPAIPPDAVLAEGARPDGTPKPSQGNTAELRAGNSGTTEVPKPAQPKSEQQKNDQIAQNMNPNALNLKDLASKILQQQTNQDQHRLPGVGSQG